MNSIFEEAMDPVTRRISENYLNQMRSAAIGGGSFSAAIVHVLLQVGISSMPLHISFYAAALGIPVWIVVWQYVQPYLLYGPVSYEHFHKASSLGVAVLLAVLALGAIFVSFTALLWHVSICAALVFSLISLLGALAKISIPRQKNLCFRLILVIGCLIATSCTTTHSTSDPHDVARTVNNFFAARPVVLLVQRYGLPQEQVEKDQYGYNYYIWNSSTSGRRSCVMTVRVIQEMFVGVELSGRLESCGSFMP